MTIFLVMAAMAAIAIVGLALPLLRPPGSGERDTAMAVLKRQLADVQSGPSSGDAEALATELKRRIIAESRQRDPSASPFTSAARLRIALALTTAVAVGAIGIYAQLGRPKLPSSLHSAESPPPTGEARALALIITRVNERLARSPGDVQGWRVLGWAELVSGKPALAANAYARAIAIDPRNAADRSAQGDCLVQAAGGLVTPAAISAFRSALALDPSDARARYFLALAKEQSGDHPGAIADWIALIRSAPPSAQWLPEVRSVVERDARAHGEDISRRLSPGAGPTDAQDSVTSRLSPAEQHAMIEHMVEGLAVRLKANPHDIDGWMRLMHARMVLGER